MLQLLLSIICFFFLHEEKAQIIDKTILRWSENYVSAWSNSSVVVVKKAVSNATGVLDHFSF